VIRDGLDRRIALPRMTVAGPTPRAGERSVVLRAIERGCRKLVALQRADGSWRGDYGGPMFLLPMYVAACRLARRPIPEARRADMVRYLRSAQQPDGSIGLHVEAGGSMFTSALGYVALRMLGVGRDDPDAARLRRWIGEHGGALGSASWGKFVLALLNLYDYEGLHPVQPELWLLPSALPFHPSRLWCHCRQVYLPMAWLYGRRARGPEDELVRELRAELYPRRYDEIRFRDERDTLAPGDRYVAPSGLLAAVNRALGLYERAEQLAARLGLPTPRARSLARVLDHIAYEDRVTSFIRIGPVNAALNTIVHVFRAEAGEPGAREEVARSFETLDRYLEPGHDGTKMNGYNSCALWDTAFAVQALLASPCAHEHRAAIERAHDYIRDNQVIEDVPERERYYRHASRGGWPFSDRAHGWPITDCTSEGLKCALALERAVAQPVPEPLLEDAVRLLLSFQNEDGGWATYELQRGPAWLERLNPSQVFGDIMVDYSYVECTSACVQALVAARARFPGRFDAAIDDAVRRGECFLRERQRGDGSWEGSWGVCFSYGTWFAVAGLLAAGATPADTAIARACWFLGDRQLADGGWGEDGSSCAKRRWVQLDAGHGVNTAWALHTLVRARRAASEPARRGARFLVDLQESDGDWPRQRISGVFNKTALINYENYRRYFPIWALSAYLAACG
jgi:squalene/oxidosqualene cyclase-like protein